MNTSLEKEEIFKLSHTTTPYPKIFMENFMPKIFNGIVRAVWPLILATVWKWGDKKIVTATEENRYVGGQAISKIAKAANTPENQKAVLGAATQIASNLLTNSTQKAPLQSTNDSVPEKNDEAPDKVSENDSIC